MCLKNKITYFALYLILVLIFYPMGSCISTGADDDESIDDIAVYVDEEIPVEEGGDAGTASGSEADPDAETQADPDEPVVVPEVAKCSQKTFVVYSSTRSLDGSDSLNVDENSNVWLLSTDGSVDVPLTYLENSNVYSSIVSTAGDKVFYISDRNLDGSDDTQPNGTQNVWMLETALNREAEADVSSIPISTMTTEEAHSTGLQVSLDGTKLVSQSVRALDGTDAINGQADGIWNVWLTDLEAPIEHPTMTFSSVPLTQSELGISMQAFFAPDVATIYYNATKGPDELGSGYAWSVWVVNASDPTIDIMFADPGENNWTVHMRHPRPSYDGQYVVFESDRSFANQQIPNDGSVYNVWLGAVADIVDEDADHVVDEGFEPTPLTAWTVADSRQTYWANQALKLVHWTQMNPDGSETANANADESESYYNLRYINIESGATYFITDLHEAKSTVGNFSPDDTQILYKSTRDLSGSDSMNNEENSNLWITDVDDSGSQNHRPLTNLTNASVYLRTLRTMFEACE